MRERFSSFTKVSILSVLIAIIGFVPGLPGLSLFTESATAAPVTLFSNGGFETGDFTGWTSVGGGWAVVSGSSNASEGTYRADSSGGINNSELILEFSTQGYENISVSYDYKRTNYDWPTGVPYNDPTADRTQVTINDGSSSYQLGFHNTGGDGVTDLTDTTWQSKSSDVSSLSSTYNDNPNVTLTFRQITTQTTEEFKLDNVVITGEPIVTDTTAPVVDFSGFPADNSDIIADSTWNVFPVSATDDVSGPGGITVYFEIVPANGNPPRTTASQTLDTAIPGTTNVQWTGLNIQSNPGVAIGETFDVNFVAEDAAGNVVTDGRTYTLVAPTTPSIDYLVAGLTNNLPNKYSGISVNFGLENITDATSVEITVNRADGSSVTKQARQSLIDYINATVNLPNVTTPIIIEDGGYGEDDSSSWYPAPSVWKSTSEPTSVDLIIERSGSNPALTATTSTFNTAVLWSDITPGPVYREGTVNGQTGAEEYFDTIQEAIDDNDGEVNGNSDDNAVGDGSTDDGDKIVLTEDLTTTAQTTITKSITLDGDGHTLDANFTKTGNSNNSALGVQADNVTIQNLTVMSSGDQPWPLQLHGVNVYESTNVVVSNVTAKDFYGTGIAYNGSTGTIQDVHTENNTWHGINIDRDGSNVSVIGNNSHNEVFADIYVDDDTQDVTVNAPDYTWQRSGIPGRDDDRVYRRLVDPNGQNQFNVSGTLYRDRALNDCNGRTDCLARTNDRLEDWEVRLYKENTNNEWQEVKSVQTDVNGVYKFGAQQEGGTYHVCFVQQTGWTQSKQTWSGSGYLVTTNNLSGDANEALYCATSTYDDTSDRSWKQNIGNVDTEAPFVDITSPTNNNILKGNIKINGTVNDNFKLKNYYLTVVDLSDNSIVYTKNYPQVSNITGELAMWDSSENNGNFRIIIEARDAAGNKNGGRNPLPLTTSGDSIDFADVTVDNTAPTTTLVAPTGTVDGTFTVSGDASDNIALNRVYVQLVNRDDNKRYGGTTINLIPEGDMASWSRDYNASTDNLPDGVYAAHVAVVDRAGNTSSQGWTDNFTVDTTAPTVAIDPIADSTDTTPTITGTVDDNDADVTVSINGTDYTATNNGDGTWTLDVTAPLAPDTYTVEAYGTDTAGNSTNPVASESFEVTEPTSGEGSNEGGTEGEVLGSATTNEDISTPTSNGGIGGDNGLPVVLAATTGTSDTSGDNSDAESSEDDDSSESEDGEVLQSTTDESNGDTDAEDDDEASEDDECFKILGICWYWWALPIAAIILYYGYRRFTEE